MPTSAQTPHPPGPAAFDIGRRLPDEQTCVVTVEGELDLAGAPRLKWMLVEALQAGCSQLVVDLSRATLLDSTAVGALVGVNTSINEQAQLAIACAQPEVLRVFKDAGLDHKLAIFPTVDEARAHFKKEAAHVG